jgi:GNAT superfamily N-acetyltransferase
MTGIDRGNTALIRPRRSEDLRPLADALAAQQEQTRYPATWPLPHPVEEFIRRPNELAAWTALIDGRPIGHVCVHEADGSSRTGETNDAELLNAWKAFHNCQAGDLAIISSLFVASGCRGLGIGGALLNHATQWILEIGMAPCLHVVESPSPAAAVCAAKGWQTAGITRPAWLPNGPETLLIMALPRR